MPRWPLNRNALVPILVLTAVGVWAAMSSAIAQPAPALAPGAQALKQLDDEWSRAAATKDAQLVASFYAEDAIAYPPNEPAAIGRAAAGKVWAAYFADASFSISWKTLHAQVAASNDLGYTSGTYEASYKGPDGAMVLEKGKYLCNWRKERDGTWKAIHDMWNTDAR